MNSNNVLGRFRSGANRYKDNCWLLGNDFYLGALSDDTTLIFSVYCHIAFLTFTEDDPVAAKMLSYNRANRSVAVLCNHQRAVPKNFSQQMERMAEKIATKKKDLKDAQRQLKDAKQEAKNSRASSVQR